MCFCRQLSVPAPTVHRAQPPAESGREGTRETFLAKERTFPLGKTTDPGRSTSELNKLIAKATPLTAADTAAPRGRLRRCERPEKRRAGAVPSDPPPRRTAEPPRAEDIPQDPPPRSPQASPAGSLFRLLRRAPAGGSGRVRDPPPRAAGGMRLRRPLAAALGTAAPRLPRRGGGCPQRPIRGGDADSPRTSAPVCFTAVRSRVNKNTKKPTLTLSSTAAGTARTGLSPAEVLKVLHKH